MLKCFFADQVTVLRQGKEVTFNVDAEVIGEILKAGASNYLSVRQPIVVGEVVGKNLKESGIQKGDKIIGINDKSTLFFDELVKELDQNKIKQLH